jgi:hypothetical protein
VGDDIYLPLIIITLCFLFERLLFFSNSVFSFRELLLLLYGINYLLSPYLSYLFPPTNLSYSMVIQSSEYFNLIIPGYFVFAIGVFFLPNKLFTNRLNLNDFRWRNQTKIIISLTIIGFVSKFMIFLVPGQIAFLFTLLSKLRYVGSFALFAINWRKYWWLVSLTLAVDLIQSLVAGMYHDFLMWCILFYLFVVFVFKPKLVFKVVAASVVIVLVLTIQSMKVAYRQGTSTGGRTASLETAIDIASIQSQSDVVFGEDNLTSTLMRANQAWIFTSTVRNMDSKQDFQGLNLLLKYLRAAILPRFLDVNKMQSGDSEVFNLYSGHHLESGTSMGLGVFADGYIAYGWLGVVLFGFGLGLLFSIIFKIVESWSKISGIYVLFLLPLMDYAVRPDCELQTVLNLLVKGVFLYGVVVSLSKYKFVINSR